MTGADLAAALGRVGAAERVADPLAVLFFAAAFVTFFAAGLTAGTPAVFLTAGAAGTTGAFLGAAFLEDFGVRSSFVAAVSGLEAGLAGPASALAGFAGADSALPAGFAGPASALAAFAGAASGLPAGLAGPASALAAFDGAASGLPAGFWAGFIAGALELDAGNGAR